MIAITILILACCILPKFAKGRTSVKEEVIQRQQVPVVQQQVLQPNYQQVPVMQQEPVLYNVH